METDNNIRVTFSNDIFRHNQNIYTHIIPFEQVTMHNHEYIEFFYVFHGDCISTINESKIKMQAGDAALIMMDDYHSFISGNNTGALHRDIAIRTDYFKRICDTYSSDLFNDLSKKKYNLLCKLSTEQISIIESYVYSLISNSMNRAIVEKTIVTFIINVIIAINCKAFRRGYPNWLVQLLTVFTSPANISKSVSSIISMFPYTQPYLCRKFREIIGITMTDYFNNQKLEYAYNLLITTDMSIQSICNAININNVSYFYKLFEKKYEISPSKCRANNRI